jgi:hypothetical protein
LHLDYLDRDSLQTYLVDPDSFPDLNIWRLTGSPFDYFDFDRSPAIHVELDN